MTRLPQIIANIIGIDRSWVSRAILGRQLHPKRTSQGKGGAAKKNIAQEDASWTAHVVAAPLRAV
jgi:hypothetical protein